MWGNSQAWLQEERILLRNSFQAAEGVQVAAIQPERWLERRPGWELGLPRTGRGSHASFLSREVALIRASPEKSGKGMMYRKRKSQEVGAMMAYT